MGTLFRKAARGGRKGNWYAEYTNHHKKRVQRSTGTRCKATAQQILNHWESEVAKRASGMIDPNVERFAAQRLRPIAEHVSEWIDSLKTAGRAKVHVDRSKKRIEAIIDSQGWTALADATPESVEAFAAKLRDLNRSNQTVAHYLQCAKQFTRWAKRSKRLASDPLDCISKPNPKADRRRLRRMLLPEEWPYLAAAAGQERRLIYETAIQTGLRANEMRQLRGVHLKCTAKAPHVVVPSNDTKDRNQACQFITRDLAADLAPYAKRGRRAAFDLPDEYKMADMLREDLSAARKEWEKTVDEETAEGSDFLQPVNHADESLDFHALRHTCGAWLAMREVHPKKIQTVMRHKTITLTMDTYGHLFPDATPEAINELSPLLRGQLDGQ